MLLNSSCIIVQFFLSKSKWPSFGFSMDLLNPNFKTSVKTLGLWGIWLAAQEGKRSNHMVWWSSSDILIMATMTNAQRFC